MKRISTIRVACLVVFTIMGLALYPFPGFAQTNDEQLPPRLIRMAAEYPGIELSAGKTVKMDLIFSNKGKSDEDVNVRITEQPEGWDTVLKTYQFTVTGIHVPSGEDKKLSFEAKPDDTVQPGSYEFHIEAQTPDQQFQMAQIIKVKVTEKDKAEEAKLSEEIQLNTTYPVLRGATDGKYEFSIEVKSDMDQDAVFDLFAQGPKDWEINFKPAYESKYISSLQIKANQSKNVSVEVTPDPTAQAGEYPIAMQVSSGGAKAEIPLKVVLTGTYKLEAGTPDGLLSLDAGAGKPANMSVYIKNTGSAPNNGISFMSFKPENWDVKFSPEKIDSLAPGDLKQVEVTITPSKNALVGDYSVGVQVKGEKASKSLEFRTTVKASAAWGGVGIFLIVAVVGGLTTLFRKLGRR